MQFNSAEEIEDWFKNNKYDSEVHQAINFLLNENKKDTKRVNPKKPPIKPQTSPLRTIF